MPVWSLLTIALSFSAPNAAAQANLRPDWVMHPVVKLATNSSFLRDFSSRARESTFLDNLIDTGSANAFRTEYDMATRNQELNRLQGRSNLATEKGYFARITKLAQDTKDRIRNHTRNQGRDKALAAARVMDLQKTESVPLMMVGVLAAAVSDVPMELNLHETTHLMARANLEQKTGSIELRSPLGKGNFNYHPRDEEERYRLSLLRDVPFSDMTSSLSYGGSSNVLTASLTKPLTDTLACVVASSRNMNPGVSWNESIKLVYGYHF